jgi:hypothetical protein
MASCSCFSASICIGANRRKRLILLLQMKFLLQTQLPSEVTTFCCPQTQSKVGVFMASQMLHISAWGGRYRLAGFSYLLLGLIAVLLVSEPELSSQAIASTSCPSTMQDCHGTCIPLSENCCEDGTHGDGADCYCCRPDSSTPTTYTCR